VWGHISLQKLPSVVKELVNGHYYPPQSQRVFWILVLIATQSQI